MPALRTVVDSVIASVSTGDVGVQDMRGDGQVRVRRRRADHLELGDLPVGGAGVGGEPQPHVGDGGGDRDRHRVARGRVEGVRAATASDGERGRALLPAEHLQFCVRGPQAGSGFSLSTIELTTAFAPSSTVSVLGYAPGAPPSTS